MSSKFTNWYEIKYELFSSNNKESVGNFLGITKTIQYLKNLNIKYLVINDIFKIYKSDFQNSLEDVHKLVGSILDFAKVVEVCRLNGIKVALKLNLQKISISIKAYKRMLRLTTQTKDIESSQKTQNKVQFLNQLEHKKINLHTQSMFIKTNTLDFENDWGADNNFENFSEFITYLNYLGVNSFIFYDYEYLYDRKREKAFSEITCVNLQRIYSLIKRINDKNILVWSNRFSDAATMLKTLNKLDNYCDYYLDETISLLNNHAKYGKDLLRNMKILELKKVLVQNYKLKNYISSLGSSLTGRLLSLWGNEDIFWEQSGRSLALLNWFHPYNKKIYFGEEIGMLNLESDFISEIKDYEMNEKKHALANEGIREEHFLFSYAQLNAINSNYPMMWSQNSNKNSRFVKKIQQINVEKEIYDPYSILSFNLMLANIFGNNAFIDLLYNSKVRFYKNYFVKDLLSYNFKSDYVSFDVHLNLTNKQISCKIKEKDKIILSSYLEKKYQTALKYLDPYESIVVLNYQNDANNDYVLSVFGKKSILQRETHD